MIHWQRFEGALILAASLWLLTLLPGATLPLWALALLFFAPDLAFAAYLAGPRAGAALYNLLHLYALGLGLLTLGLALPQPLLVTLGALWLGHAGFDRMLGYGLKSATGFHDTHLGRIGRG